MIAKDWIKFRSVKVLLYEDLRPGEYVALNPNDANYKTMWVVMRCDLCGALTSIGRTLHDVDWRGVISPPCRCPHKGCNRAGWTYLEDWHPLIKGCA